MLLIKKNTTTENGKQANKQTNETSRKKDVHNFVRYHYGLEFAIWLTQEEGDSQSGTHTNHKMANGLECFVRQKMLKAVEFFGLCVFVKRILNILNVC